MVLLFVGAQVLAVEKAAADACDPPANKIVCENSKPGNPASEWDVTGAGDPGIQGFATEISVDRGETVHFKVKTDSTEYRLDIYRMGYYGGDGARRVATVHPSTGLPQVQPPCDTEPSTGLIDCGNWAESASWAVPGDAVSGIYFAKLQREDQPSEGSHIVFVVRDDGAGSDLLFQTSDTTWEAYNSYGGNSLYEGGPGTAPGRAYKVSYNRPLTTRGTAPEDGPFGSEYPMVRWLERNGYDVSYSTGADTDRSGEEILDHKAFLSVGHDEYWSADQRGNVEAARDAGVNLAFFSGNEIFWKTRWEDSIDGSGTDRRTLVCYKETHANAKIDPEADVWTGTWQDPRFSPPADGGRPQNQLTGTRFAVNSGTAAIEVPAADGKMRLWRGTGIASLEPGETASLGERTLGYEWDEDVDNGFRPPGLMDLSSTTLQVPQKLLDYGSNYAPGTATHHLTLYRAPGGALVFGAGTVQWSWGLDGFHDQGQTTPDQRMQQATVNLLADMGTQPQALQGDLLAATQTTDTDPPSATIAAPSDGAEVESGRPISIGGIANDVSGETVGGRVAGVEVSTDGGARWHPAKGREQWSYAWTPGKLGATTIMARAVDDSGNLQAPASQVEIDVVPHTCPCSIWDNTFTAPEDPDHNSIEVGVKFQADTPGFITGLRFYKTSGNTGIHVGHLWTQGGTQIAEAKFVNETATGWQEVSFGSPVAIDPDTTYVASYHAPTGHYAALGDYFALVGTDSAPLHALADGVSGPNGIYRYGPSGGLFSGEGPQTFQSANYLVDVVFEHEVGPDESPPTVSSTKPAANATGVAAGSAVTATFNESLDPETVGNSTVELRDESEAMVPASVSYSAPGKRVTLRPDAPLQNSAHYTAKIMGGVGGVTDLAGNPLAADASWSFTTAAPPPPPPEQGPGGPILVISNSGNPFSRYYAEILRAEGLNEFGASDITAVSPSVLAAHDVAILGEGPLTAGQATMLGNWVQAGGNLIAMRPDQKLAGLLGLQVEGGTLSNAYLKVDTGTEAGAGIVGETIQFHGTADRYGATDAKTVATLYADDSTSTSSPAVTVRSVGDNGGHAAAFSYDLAKSVVYTRQGNPAWAGEDRDGVGPIRSDDLFFGAKEGDAKPDWVDLSKVAIPQADEQQRLLTNLVERMNVNRKPLPRFWFLPRDAKAAVVMTGDDHAGGGTVGRLNQYEEDSAPGCVVADWECVRSTSYIYPETPIADAQAADFTAAGFEIGLHVFTNCADWSSQAQLKGLISSQLEAFEAKFPSLPPPATNRTHCIVWSDWASQPKAELESGIRLDTDYYYWPGSWVKDRPGMFTGSGMPMRFADLDGSMIDVFQAPTQMTDESEQSYPFTVDTLLDNALGSNGYYGVFTANIHTDEAASADSDAIVAAAQERGVPIVSAHQMLTWLDGRNRSSFGSLNWSGNKLSFTIDAGEGTSGLRGMLPITSQTGGLVELKRGGVPVDTTVKTIKGLQYEFFDATAGSYTATYESTSIVVAIDSVSRDLVGAGGSTDVSWHASDNGTYALRVGGTDCSSGTVVDSGAYTSQPAQHTSTVAAADLAEGTNTLRICLTDNTSHTSRASTTVSLDSISPQTQIDSHPDPLSASASASFTFSGSDPGGSGIASLQCRLDGAAFAPCSSPTPYSSLADGPHSFEVRAIDTAANTDPTPATFAWSVDTTAPQTQIDSHPDPLSASASASFTFSGSDPGGSGIASLQCRLDGAAFAPCSSPTPYSSLADGPHSFEVRAIDTAANTDPTPATFAWSVDTTAPQSQIDSHPDPLSASASASFTFSGSDPGGSGIASLQCRLDGAAFAPCSSPTPYSSLADGPHSFEVRAIDTAANTDPTPATFAWSVDTTAPQTQIDSHPDPLSASASASFTFSGSDPGGSGIASLQCRLDGAAFAPCSSPTPYSSLADGPHSFEVRAIDTAANTDPTPATFAWSVDTTAPQSQIDSHPDPLSASASASFTFSGSDPGGSGIASLQCRLDGAAFAPCSSPTPYSSLADGPHSFEVRAIDTAANTDPTPATFAWSVDTTAPQTQIDSHPDPLSASASASFTFSGSDPGGSGIASLQCRLDGAAFAPCSSPTPYSSLADGPHSFEVRAIDTAANTDPTPATFAWSVDTTAPQTQIDSHPDPLSASASASFTFSGSDPGGSGIASLQCRLDGAAFAPCSSPTPYSSLADGPHSFEVRAIDTAANTDPTPATFAWSVDTTAPQSQIDSHPDPLSASASASFTFSGSDPGGSGIASLQCRLDGAAFAPCSSPTPYSSLADGPHSFEVRAIDTAANTDPTPATFAWSVDTTAPSVTIDSGPSGLTNNSSPAFTFHGGGEGGLSFECSIDSGTPDFGACSGAGSHSPSSPITDGPHTFRVRVTDSAQNQSTATRSFTVDTVVGAAPALSATLPASPANQNSPKVIGSAPAGTTVAIYASTDCSGSPLAGGSAAELAAGITVTVGDDTTTSLRATSTTPAENTSACSAPIAYTEDSTAPQSQIDAGPSGTINTATATFAFSSDPGASFACSLDGAAFAPCGSPKAYGSLGEGAHEFKVRATDAAGNVDASPAARSFTVDTRPIAGPGHALLRLLGVKSNRTTGTALVFIRIFAAGRLSVSSPGPTVRNGKRIVSTKAEILESRERKIERRIVQTGGPERVEIPIRLKPAGRKLLLERHKLRVQVEISFQAVDGSSVSRTVAITLKRKPGARQ